MERSISVTTASANNLSQGGMQELKESQWLQGERVSEEEATDEEGKPGRSHY